MKITVYETGASSWRRDGLSLYKTVSIRTSIGKRDQDISITYHRGREGALHCLLTFYFDFELVPDANLDGQWCVIALASGDVKGGGGSFQYSSRDGRSLLTSDDPAVHKLFFALLATKEWMASVWAREDIIWQFPIPFDASLKPALMTLSAELRNETHASN